MILSLLILLHVSSALTSPCLDDDPAELRKQLASTDVAVRKAAVTRLSEIGSERGLKKEEVELLLPLLKADKEPMMIKTRVALVLSYSLKAEWVMDPLIAALKDRDTKSNANGLVPLYAAGALAQLGDLKALPAIEEWLDHLEKSKPDVYPIRDKLIFGAKKSIADLKEKAKEKAVKKP